MTLLAVRAIRKALRIARQVLRRKAPPGPAPLSAATIDLDAPAVALDPFPAYDLLRTTGPVHFLPRHEAWIIVGHEELRAAFLLPQLLSNRPYEDVDAVLLAADPPAHTAVRRIASRYFTREGIEAIGAEVRAAARALLQRPALEVVGEYAAPLSELAAARLIGFDEETLPEVRAAEARYTSFERYIADLRAVAHRAAMYEGLRGDGLDEAQARSLVALFWVASLKTTERTITACAYRLMTHAAVRQELERDPTATGRFIDEVLRLHQPEPMLRRLARSPVEVGGVAIPAGAMVYLSLAAANRDPRRYEAPHEVRMDRTGGGHLSFGHGIHFCVGATLARTVVDAAVHALLEEGRALRLAPGPGSVRWQAAMMVLFIDRLALQS